MFGFKSSFLKSCVLFSYCPCCPINQTSGSVQTRVMQDQITPGQRVDTVWWTSCLHSEQWGTSSSHSLTTLPHTKMVAAPLTKMSAAHAQIHITTYKMAAVSPLPTLQVAALFSTNGGTGSFFSRVWVWIICLRSLSTHLPDSPFSAHTSSTSYWSRVRVKTVRSSPFPAVCMLKTLPLIHSNWLEDQPLPLGPLPIGSKLPSIILWALWRAACAVRLMSRDRRLFDLQAGRRRISGGSVRGSGWEGRLHTPSGGFNTPQ